MQRNIQIWMKAVLIITERSAWRSGLDLCWDFRPFFNSSHIVHMMARWIFLWRAGMNVNPCASEPKAAEPRAELRARRRAGMSPSCRSAAIDTLRRMLCLFAQQSCLMLFAYQGDQHGSDNTCLTPPAFSHQRVDLLSRLLFSGRQFLALSVNGVNNSHQYLI